MNRLLIFLILFLSLISLCYSMNFENINSNISDQNFVKIPGHEILIIRFRELLVLDFYAKADNIRKLAGEIVDISTIPWIIYQDLKEYTKHLTRSEALFFINELSIEILEILLGDFSDELKLAKDKWQEFYPVP